ncbi:hypothetical protein COV18_02325 [Candidatus Woesearchaeota archaeon CG10_big_fil_rev_8_21_14_0_10_37_12]|nr:MAG: hypothetical protein COV18_02325 [Candidatus Woesearchaeota archaeon CG10_big_fil_rev_8_21_14_0_10_37_12]
MAKKRSTKIILEKQLKELASLGFIKNEEARKLARALITEVKQEQQKMTTYAKKEFTQELKKAKQAAKPYIKRAIKHVEKRIDEKLTDMKTNKKQKTSRRTKKTSKRRTSKTKKR